jgi:HSP20 family protein
MKLMQREPRTVSSPAAVGLEPFALMRNLMRWDPFRDMDFNLDTQASFTPSFDIRETPGAYLFEADLPGIGQEDLDINLTGNRLSVTGKRECSDKKEGENYYAMERSFGCFCRSFNLPEGVDAEGIKAEMKDGVLTLTLPKTPEVQPKKISISAGSRSAAQPTVQTGA